MKVCNNYSRPPATIFTELEADNCFSRQVIISTTAFSFVLFFSSSKASRNHVAVILNISASVLYESPRAG